MSMTRKELPESHTGLQLERLLFFTDAVFAIALTLLAIELKVPDLEGSAAAQELPRVIAQMWPQFISFAVSFLVVALFWTSHHRVFGLLERFDHRLIWLNLLFLFGIVFLPFPTALLGKYGDTRYATIFYAASVGAIGLTWALVWVYISRGQRLISPHVPNAAIRRYTFTALITPSVFLLSMPVALIDVGAAQLMWLLLALYFVVFPTRLRAA
jgi:uncharacterized membrane protein